MNYYVYVYLNEEGEVNYVGKGKGKRMDWRWGRKFEIPPKERRMKVFENLTEEESLMREECLIKLYGKDNLLNQTTGGQGVSGLKNPHTEEWKIEMSERFSGEKNPYYGRKHSEETREKMRESGKNRKNTNYKENQRKSQSKLTYRFLNPDGELVVIEGSLNQFCQENGLNNGRMSQLHREKIKDSHHKGWRIP